MNAQQKNSDSKIVRNWLSRYVAQNGGIQACRHGGCYELADAFQEKHPDAEHWETCERNPGLGEALPLVTPFETVDTLRAELNETTEDISWLGSFGGHVVCVWRGLVFDAAGISTFESITQYFHTLDNFVWVRTS